MPDSQSQVRWAHSVVEGQAKGDRAFALEVIRGMRGRKMNELPQHTKKQPVMARLRKK